MREITLPFRTPLTGFITAAAVFLFTATFASVAVEPQIDENLLAPQEENLAGIFTPDWAEPGGPPTDTSSFGPQLQSFGAIAPATRQPLGALSGRIVFMNSGHGWTFDPAQWRLQRGVGNSMNEDYGNLDQLNFFAAYCFNAGATVVSFRPLGHQTNEVVLDNDDAAVTFAGSWSDSSSTYFWGSPGDVPYRFASLAATETATATYTPTIPVPGFYPVYTWVRAGSDRGDQLYRIRHTGGESQIRIPHHMVGNGWIYLGEYYFNAGANAASGSVVISNLRGTATGTVIIADAIRFGNGMGSVDQGSGVSGYPREDENMRYWIKANLGQGQSTALYEGSGDDESDSWSAPGKMSAEMNREQAGDIFDRVNISFHSNASDTNHLSRGSEGLITGDETPYQEELAFICGKQVNDELVALGAPPLEVAFKDRGNSVTYTGGYGEISGSYYQYEMAATIIEVAYHDNVSDALILRDPKGRAAIGKAAMHAVIKYLNQYDTNNPVALNFLPEPPTNVRALAANTNGQIALSWAVPVNLGGSQSPTNYVVYFSTNGYGFGNPVSIGNITTFTVSNLAANVDYYFRISASNAGGESMPSEVVGCRVASTNNAPRVLVVNAFDRFDRTTNLRQNTTLQNYGPPGPNGTIERVWPRSINSFDYVVPHGKAISAYGMAFDSCQNEAIINNQVFLTNYPIVIWACGNESTNDETFNATEQTRVAAFLATSGNLFVSGSDVAFDLDRPSGPTVADRNFLHNQLHATYVNDNSTSYTGAPVSGGIFAGRASATFDDGSKGIYWVKTPDVIAASGPGTLAALNYSGGTGGAAAVQYDGAAGAGRVVLLGFPFETITSTARRNEYMADILTFLSQPPSTNVSPVVLTSPLSQTVVQGSNATLSVIATGTAPLSYQWRFNGVDLPGATDSSYTRTNAQPVHSGNYDVVVANGVGLTNSAVALVEVILPPLQTLFGDTFDANTAASWVTNRSSADTRVTFNYNYALNGIPSAPNSSGGTTRGVKFEANMTVGTNAAINISPVGQSFTGNYRLHFDLWINQNGPFPLGGNGSTQHGTAGVSTTGDRVQWTGAGTTANGYWFAVDGEGQASDASPDFRAYTTTTLQTAASGVYAGGTDANVRRCSHPYYATKFPGGQTAPASQQSSYPQQTGGLAAGTIGFAWRDVIINKTGNTVEWFIDGLKIATIGSASFTGNNIFIGYWDSFSSLSDNTNLSFGVFDNVRVERFVTNTPPYLTMQPLGANVKVGDNVLFSVSGGGTATLAYQWRLNGTNILGATGSSYARTGVDTNDAGNYSVFITNASGSVLSSNALLSVTPWQPLKFELITPLPDGQVRLVISGDPDLAVKIFSSTNLTDWDELITLPNPSGIIEYTDSVSSDVLLRYYRAQEQ